MRKLFGILIILTAWCCGSLLQSCENAATPKKQVRECVFVVTNVQPDENEGFEKYTVQMSDYHYSANFDFRDAKGRYSVGDVLRLKLAEFKEQPVNDTIVTPIPKPSVNFLGPVPIPDTTTPKSTNINKKQ